MVRAGSRSAVRPGRALREGGGGPSDTNCFWVNNPSSPRRRRWSGRPRRPLRRLPELSAKAEVVRRRRRRSGRRARALREGGGGPRAAGSGLRSDSSSPRRRRWSGPDRHRGRREGELSAKAEVVRIHVRGRIQHGGALREGGGGPRARNGRSLPRESSPRRRRWSGARIHGAVPGLELSAKAEVVRRTPRPATPRARALREGGGGPTPPAPTRTPSASSPRRRRWSVQRLVPGRGDHELSAKAEVVRRPPRALQLGQRALREGGGGPPRSPRSSPPSASSPRRRRWSEPVRPDAPGAAELSAKAEVVRPRPPSCSRGCRALREGGGGPAVDPTVTDVYSSSPRRRRWSAAGLDVRAHGLELSAKAEVARRMRRGSARRC